MEKYQKYIKHTYKAARFLGCLIAIMIIAIIGLTIYSQANFGFNQFSALFSLVEGGLINPLSLITTVGPMLIYPILLIVSAHRIKKSQNNIDKVKKELLYLLIFNIIALFFGAGLFALVLIGYPALTRHYINKFKKNQTLTNQV